jgi:hypothetical protein
VGRQQMPNVMVKQGRKIAAKATVEADPKDPDELRQVLLDALKREDLPTSRIGAYQMEVRKAGYLRRLTTIVARP